MKFGTNKKMLVIAISVPCMFSMVGCMVNNGQHRSPNTPSTTNISSSIFTSVDSNTEPSEVTEPTQVTSETLSFSDRVDNTLLTKNIVLTTDEIEQFLRTTGIELYGFYNLGFGNPILQSKIQEYFSDDTLGVQDFSCLHNTWDEENYYENFENAYNDFDIDYVRYVLEENGLRLWTDEIPYEFFAEKFPDYVEKFNNSQYLDIEVAYNENFVGNVLQHHDYMFHSSENDFDGRIVNLDYANPDNNEAFRLASFMQLIRYNYYRDFISSSYTHEDEGPIKQGLTEDGKFVWVPTEKQYNSFQEQYVSTIPRCENVDILVPETRDDLVASGIDVEKYDDFCEKFYGGAKMEKNKTQDDQSRSRG